MPLRRIRSMKRKLFSRSSFGQSLSLVCDGYIDCPSDLVFSFLHPQSVQWGHRLKLCALLVGTNVSISLHYHISSFDSKKAQSPGNCFVLMMKTYGDRGYSGDFLEAFAAAKRFNWPSDNGSNLCSAILM
jgi:hypothetical protein